jgi:hypothetical protein
MTTQDYVSRDELAARLAEFELRLERRIDDVAWRLVALLLGVYALIIGTLVALVLFSLNIISRRRQANGATVE